MAGAVHRHRTGRRQSGVLGSAAHHAHGRRLLPRSASPSCARWIWQRRRVPSWPGALAALIDETIAHAKAVPAEPRPFSRAQARHRGTGGQGRSRGLCGLRHLREVCPYGAPMINDLKKAEIQGAPAWAAARARRNVRRIPSPATPRDGQMTAMLDELLSVGGGAR